MKNLINFLSKYSFVFLFLLLEIVSLILLSTNKGYQRSILLSSTNRVTGRMLDVSSNFFDFFKLKKTNEGLAKENSDLKNQVVLLENQLSAYTDTLFNTQWQTKSIAPDKKYEYIPAKVIKLTTQYTNNYITLNKGSDQGIKPDMGVISEDGVVGIVQTVSSKFSKVIPILNPQAIISTKFKKNNYYGPLEWNGKDYRYASLKDIARHVTFSLGDTLITSGLVKTFPEGIMIGTINNYNIKESDAYYDIQVKLSVNFRTLVYVKVINYLNYEEQMQLESQQSQNHKEKKTNI